MIACLEQADIKQVCMGNFNNCLEVLLNLYQALFLTDSDGAESISGIDIGHQQTLDFGVEMYTGDGSELLLTVTTSLMLFATSIFSLVLLSRGSRWYCRSSFLLKFSVSIVVISVSWQRFPSIICIILSILAVRNLTIGMYTKYYELQDCWDMFRYHSSSS